ncbi:hypothetical protein Tco_0015733 [Tanacetum coccineum]
MTGDRSRLKNFVNKFIRTVRFGNDHFGAIMDYGDYVIGDSVISRVYYVEGLGHNLFFVGQFCDSDLEAISAIEMLWEWRGIANLAFIQLGWVSRVDEMILARVSSGFAGEEVWEDIQVVPGFVGRERRLFGEVAVLSPQVV